MTEKHEYQVWNIIPKVDTSKHNPDSQCVECCAKIEEIHSKLVPLLEKIDHKVESFDTARFSEMIEKLQGNTLIKLLLK